MVVIVVGFPLSAPMGGTPASFLLPSNGATANSPVSVQGRLDHGRGSSGRQLGRPGHYRNANWTQRDDECVTNPTPTQQDKPRATECRGGSSDLHPCKTPPYGLVASRWASEHRLSLPLGPLSRFDERDELLAGVCPRDQRDGGDVTVTCLASSYTLRYLDPATALVPDWQGGTAFDRRGCPTATHGRTLRHPGLD